MGFLASGWNSSGTFLVGLSLDTGAELCTVELPFIGEYGIVGGGQSLSLDTVGNRLIITGLAAADGPHLVLSADLGSGVHSSANRNSIDVRNNSGNSGSCGLGQFEKLGTFAYSGSVPVAHSSELDSSGATLYTNLATDEHTYAIGVVDVTPLKAGDFSNTSLLKKMIPMDNGERSMWGMSWHSASNQLVSVQHNAQEGSTRNGDLDWRTLDPIATPEVWSSTPLGNPVYNATLNFTAVWGNLGSVRAYDHSGAGMLFVLVAVNRQEKIHIGMVDATTGALVAASPQISEGGKLLWASNGLLQIAVLDSIGLESSIVV